jgi:hypothetical protein
MATKIGRTIARLLNYGFPIGSATNLVQSTMFSGEHYAVVGDSNVAVAQSKGGPPGIQKIRLAETGEFNLRINVFTNQSYGIGAMFAPHFDMANRNCIMPGEYGPWEVDKSTLNNYLNQEPFPVVAAGEFYWSNDLSVPELKTELKKNS